MGETRNAYKIVRDGRVILECIGRKYDGKVYRVNVVMGLRVP